MTRRCSGRFARANLRALWHRWLPATPHPAVLENPGIELSLSEFPSRWRRLLGSFATSSAGRSPERPRCCRAKRGTDGPLSQASEIEPAPPGWFAPACQPAEGHIAAGSASPFRPPALVAAEEEQAGKPARALALPDRRPSVVWQPRTRDGNPHP